MSLVRHGKNVKMMVDKVSSMTFMFDEIDNRLGFTSFLYLYLSHMSRDVGGIYLIDIEDTATWLR